MLETVTPSLAPVIDAESRILLLGTMPSPKSRETGFYYGHPQNQFWNVLAAVFDTGTPQSIPEKLAFLHAHHIALWDVLHSCEIKGAEDSSIQNPVVHDIRSLLSKAPIRQIFTTGKKATALYTKYCFPDTQRESIYLPSTSAANRGRFPFTALVTEYSILRTYLTDVTP